MDLSDLKHSRPELRTKIGGKKLCPNLNNSLNLLHIPFLSKELGLNPKLALLPIWTQLLSNGLKEPVNFNFELYIEDNRVLS